MIDGFVAMQIARKASENQFAFDEAHDGRAPGRRRARSWLRGSLFRRGAPTREPRTSSELRRADAA